KQLALFARRVRRATSNEKKLPLIFDLAEEKWCHGRKKTESTATSSAWRCTPILAKILFNWLRPVSGAMESSFAATSSFSPVANRDAKRASATVNRNAVRKAASGGRDRFSGSTKMTTAWQSARMFAARPGSITGC